MNQKKESTKPLPEHHQDDVPKHYRDDVAGESVKAGKKRSARGNASAPAPFESQNLPKKPNPTQEKYIKDIVATIRDPLLVLDTDLRVLSANRSFHKLFKVKQKETVGNLIYDLANRQWDIPSLRLLLETILPQKAVFNDYEVEYNFPSVGKRTLLLNARRIPGPPKAAQWILLAIKDVTNRKLVEQSLQENEEKFRSLFNNAEVGMFRTRLDGSEILDMNEKFLTIFGRTREEMQGSASVLHWADPRERQEMVRQLEAEGHVIDFECGMLDKQGQVRRCLTSMRLYREQGILEGSILDITERKQVEEARQQSEILFRALFEASPDAVMLMDPQDPNVSWPIIDCNAAACVMNGYRQDELIGHSIDIVNITPGSPSERIAYLKQLREAGSLKLDTFHRHKNGTIFPIEVSTTLIKIGSRELVMGIDRDITERKQVEESLRKSESNLQAVLQSTADGILAVSSENEVIYANERFAEMWRIPPEVMASKDDSVLLQLVLDQLSDPQSFIKQVQELYKSEKKSFDTLYFKDGRVFERLSYALMQETKVHGRVWSFRDITARKQAEEALTSSEAELRALFSSMNDVVLVIDRDGVYREIAPTNPSLLVKPPQELLGKTLREVFPPEQAEIFLRVIQQVLDTKQTAQIEYDLVIGDRTVQFATSISLMTEDSTLWVARDITKRKQFELVQDAIYRITQTAITSEGIDALYHSIHSILGELIPAENFYIALIDPASNLLSFPYYIDQCDEPPTGMTQIQGLTGYVIRSGRPLLATREIFDRLVGQGEVEVVGTVFVEWMGAPLKVGGRMIGVMAVQTYTQEVHFDQEELNLFEFVSTQVAQAIERKRMEQEILNLSLTDELTGLSNRRGFTLLAEHEVKLAHRIKRTMLLFFCDVDHLKTINDTHGHAQGDQALKEVSAILKKNFREVDILARFGGDEFVILAVDASLESAKNMTNRIQATLEARNQQCDLPYHLTLSLGVARYDPEDPCTLSELIAEADGLMYSQKQTGKGKK